MTRKLFMLSLSAAIAIVAVAQESADSLVHQLQEVVITAKIPVTELQGTALVSKISGSPLQNLGTGIDVLGQLPMIQVEGNNVSIVGKGVPEIYIDGHPLRNNEELVRLQSDNIRTVELEMAPGARYDSNTSAVLKITTRRNTLDGFSFTDRSEVKFRRKVSVMDMLDVNYRTGAWDFFASGKYNHSRSVVKGSTTNSLIYDGVPTMIGTTQIRNYPADTWSAEPGFNYFRDALSFGGIYHYSRENSDFTNLGSEWLNDATPVRRQLAIGTHSYYHRGSVYFENTFSDEYTLHFDGDYKFSEADNDNSTTYTDDIYPPVNSKDTRKSSLWAGKLTFDFPLRKGVVSIGTQDSYTHTTLDYRMFNAEVAEYVPSSLSDARQLSLAAFASWSCNFGKLGLTAGLRYEYVDYNFKTDGVRDEDVSHRDNILTPDISLSYDFNERMQISLSYKMATIKPPYSQMTGSLKYTGRHEIEGGNPALQDEHRHNVELFGSWRDFMIQAGWSRSIDSYGFVKSVYPAPSLQLLMRPVNLDFSDLNLYLVWQKKIRMWNPSFTAGVSKQWLTYEGEKYDKPIFAYYLGNTFELPYGIVMTANIEGQSSGNMSTNRFGASWVVMDMSLRKSFLNKSLILQVSASDIFNTRNNSWTINTCRVFVDRRQSYDYRGVSVSLTYRLQPKKSRYQGKDASEEEINRL